MSTAALDELEAELQSLSGKAKTQFLAGLDYKWISTPIKEWVGIYDLGHQTEQWEVIQFGKPPEEVLGRDDVIIPAHCAVPYFLHRHRLTTADLKFYDGAGYCHLDDTVQMYSSGDEIHVPKGVGHGFVVVTPTFFLSRQPNPILDPQTGKMDFDYVAMEKQPPQIVELKQAIGLPMVSY